MSGEFSRIATYFAPLAGAEGRGLTDDAAVFTPPPGRELVLTVDQMLEQIHFLPNDAPDLIARKLLRRNLSDLAAMGAIPIGYLLTVALTASVDDAWLSAFAQGLAEDQAAFRIKLFGGDTSSSRGGIALSATLIGHAAPGAALSRNSAKQGDCIWVTGTIGDAALGLRARLGKLEDKTGVLVQRSLLPSPRVGLSLAGIANAAIDISDGLVQDLGHMCKGAGLSAVIRASLIPTSPAAAALGPGYLEARLTEGDDYELLLAVPPGKGDALKAACNGLSITKIGVFQPGTGVHVLADDGTLMNFAKGGWEHF